ncbi:hypothetical protein ACHAO9_000254 [Fusarium lateritium]
MRGFIPLLLALSASYTPTTALPQPRIALRDTAAGPKYSVVPLEPGNEDPASGDDGSGDGNGSSGNGNGNGGSSNDKDGDGIVTVIQTVTRKPVTQVVTRTEKPSIITAPGKTVTKAISQAVPTTVSVINMDEGPVTETVTVPHPSPSKSEAPKKATTTQKPIPTTENQEPTVQSTSQFFSSAAGPVVTSQPKPEPQPQPKPQPQPQPQPKPEPKSSTTVEPAQSTETPSTTCDTDTLPPIETVAKPPATENSAADPNPTTLLIPTSQGAGLPEETVIPSPDAPVAPIPPQETFVHDPATQGESWSTAGVPYVPPVAPTTLLTFVITTTTTTSDFENETPEPISPSKSQDDGAWHTSYPAWTGADRAI